MKDKEEQKQILSRFGVSRVEYEGMICPYYGTPLGPREMASYTVLENHCCSSECEADAFSADDYLMAIEGMIAKGWLCLQQEEKPQPVEGGVPQKERYPVEPGSVVFTRAGYLLHRQLLRELYGREFMEEADSFTTVDREKCEIHFYAETKSLCEKWIHKLRQVSLKLHELAVYVDPPMDFVSAEGPSAIGKWKPSSYLTLPEGYCAIVRYRKQEAIPFNVPELQLKSEISSFQPVWISGKITEARFSFCDNSSWDCGPDGEMDDTCAMYQWDFTIDGPSGIETPAKAHLAGETYTGGFGTRNILFQLEEPYLEPRKAPLSLVEAKRIVRDCAMKYIQQLGSS